MSENMDSIFSSVIPAKHYGILYAEMRTGVVIDQYGDRVLGGSIKYLIFTSLDDARFYAQQKVVENPEMECAIFNDRQERVDLIRNTEYISHVMDEEIRRNEARRAKKPWWRLW